MAFTNKPFIWKNNGVTPPETLQNSGFIGGKKLPAPYVNAQWTATYKAIEELQQKAGEVKTVNNIQPDSNGNVLIPLPDVSKFYQKPTTGIPKTDLESSVQTALTKAESALQSVPLATAALDGLMAKGDKVSLDNVMSVFANLQKMKITNDDGSAIYTIGATLPTVKKGIFHATASTGTYAPPASSVEGIIIAESASYWNFIGASDNGTWCVGTYQGSWKGWTTLATAKDVSNLSTRITALETSDTTHQADLAHVHFIGTAVGTNTLTATYEAITTLKNGLGVAFLNTTSSTGATTLNINGFGAIPILKANGNPVTNLKANGIYTLRYANGNFILQGEGGEYGTATANDVRKTKTFGTESGVQQGALDLTNLTPSNIKNGVTIDGVTGTILEGGMNIPNNTDLRLLMVTAIESNGDIYALDNGTGPVAGRRYSKTMTLLESISKTNPINGFTPDGYVEKIDGNNIAIKNRSGTLLSNFGYTNIGYYVTLLRGDKIFWYNTSSQQMWVTNFSGSLIVAANVEAGSIYSLNKKNNFVVMTFSASTPNNILRIDINNIVTQIKGIRYLTAGIDMQNW